ncbi:hypothetical protein ACQ5SO_06090 [Rhodovulum sp. DZ06]|uniref:hypothetical protein n=1 Tax=Rhodovulum sp. DZ06 TaxID=3425126 RepID=UPI003D34C690
MFYSPVARADGVNFGEAVGISVDSAQLAGWNLVRQRVVGPRRDIGAAVLNAPDGAAQVSLIARRFQSADVAGARMRKAVIEAHRAAFEQQELRTFFGRWEAKLVDGGAFAIADADGRPWRVWGGRWRADEGGVERVIHFAAPDDLIDLSWVFVARLDEADAATGREALFRTIDALKVSAAED